MESGISSDGHKIKSQVDEQQAMELWQVSSIKFKSSQ